MKKSLLLHGVVSALDYILSPLSQVIFILSAGGERLEKKAVAAAP